MKKIYSLLLACIATSPVIYAKTTGVSVPNIFPHMGSESNSPMPVNSRITAYTHLKHNGNIFVPVDSTTYSYAFGRGGQLTREDMDDNFVNFDNSYTYTYTKGGYRNDMHRWQVFNSAGRAQRYTIETWDTTAQSWKNWGRYVYYYNSDITLITKTNFEIYSGGLWTNHYQYNNSYSTNNNLVRVSATTLRMSFQYDASGNVLSRSDSILDFTLGGVWEGNEKYDFTYSGNTMLSYTVQTSVNGVWTNRDKFEHTYVGGLPDYTIVYTWNNNNWEPTGKHVYAYDAYGNKISDEWQVWDATTGSFNSTSRLMWTYNSFKQPLTYYSETYDATSGLWSSVADDFLYRYYYQTFIPAAVTKVSDGLDAKLYPNPAQRMLNVDFADKNTKGLLSVFDAQGKIVKTQHVAGSGHESIDVSGLPSGTYYLKLTGDKAQYSTSFVVAH